MTTFTARTDTLWLDLGSRVTFTPATHKPGALPPPLPAGLVVPVQLAHDSVDLAIEAATRTELTGRTPDGRRFRLTPQRPTEWGGFYEDGKGMSVWVVRGCK